MCYFLYGAVNNGINEKDYHGAAKDSRYHFRTGTIRDVNDCVETCGAAYRITEGACDCDTAIGSRKTGKNELNELAALLVNLRKVRGIRYVLLSKNWWKEVNEKQETVHIDDIDAVRFLADVEDNCLYKIGLYRRYD